MTPVALRCTGTGARPPENNSGVIYISAPQVNIRIDVVDKARQSVFVQSFCSFLNVVCEIFEL